MTRANNLCGQSNGGWRFGRFALLAAVALGALGALAQIKLVEYIETDGLQYIDTDFIPDGNTTFEVKALAPHNQKSAYFLFGASDGYQVNSFAMFLRAKSSTSTFVRNNSNKDFAFGKDAVSVLRIEPNRVLVDDQEVATLSGTFQCSRNMLLFAENRNGVINEAAFDGVRIYSAKLWNGSTLVRDFVPVVRDDVPCLYDHVSNRFFASGAQTGSLKAGPIVDPVEGDLIWVVGEPSEYGSPEPGYGVYTELTEGETTQFTCPAAFTNAEETVAVSCRGYRLTQMNGAVSTGSGNTTSIVYSAALSGSTLTWLWDIHCKVSVKTRIGSAESSIGDAWTDSDGRPTVTAPAAPEGYQFLNWAGDGLTGVDVTQPTVTVQLTTPGTLTAVYGASGSGGWMYDATSNPKTLSEVGVSGTPWVLNVLVENEALSLSSVAQAGTSEIVDLRAATLPVDCPPIKVMKKSLFQANTTLQKIYLPETLEKIEADVFHGCTSLTSVVPFLPASVKQIGAAAFYGCTSLKCNLTLSNPELTEITDCSSYGVFKFCPIAEIDLSKSGVTKIGQVSFADSSADRMVVKMPDGVASVATWAFSVANRGDCYWRTIPNDLAVGSGAFFRSNSLNFRHFIPEGNPVWENYLTLKCSPTDLTAAELAAYEAAYPGDPLPAKKIHLGNYNSNEWQYLVYWDPSSACELSVACGASIGSVSVELVSGQEIEKGVYRKGSQVKLTFVPASGITFAKWLCEGLSAEDAVKNPLTLTIDGNKAVSVIVDGKPWIYDAAAHTVTDGDWVLNVTENAGELTIVSVQTVASDDTRLDLANAPVGCSFTVIGSKAFQGQKNLTLLRLPETLTTIGQDAFSGCVSLKTVTPFLPASVTSIGGAAFHGDPIESALVLSNPNLTTIPTLSEYGVFKDSRIPSADLSQSGLTEIGRAAFQSDTALTDIAFPPSLKVIGQAAFSGCTCVTNITLPAGLTTLGQDVFSGCSFLQTVTPFLPASVTSIGAAAFYGCVSLRCDLDLSNPQLTKLFELGDYGTFTKCPLRSADMSKSGITNIPRMTFADGLMPMTVKFAKGVASIGQYTFSITSSANDFYWRSISPELSVNAEAFWSENFTNRHFIPRGDAVWEEYLATKCTVEELSAAELAAYQAKYPGAKKPAAKFKIPSGLPRWQYLIYYSPASFQVIIF